MSAVAVLGGGSWGTTLANLLAAKGEQVRLWAYETEVVEAMVASLPDPALAGSLRRLLTKDLLARRRPDSSRRREDSRPAEREDS